jgi:hypothetical protein
MLLLGILTLIMTIPLASLYLSTILIHGFVLLIFLFITILFVCNVEVLGGSFQITILSQNLEFLLILGGIIFKIPFILGSFSFLEESNILLSLIPIIIYTNAETDKLTILINTKGKARIYPLVIMGNQVKNMLVVL